jgi:hypothetical protein
VRGPTFSLRIRRSQSSRWLSLKRMCAVSANAVVPGPGSRAVWRFAARAATGCKGWEGGGKSERATAAGRPLRANPESRLRWSWRCGLDFGFAAERRSGSEAHAFLSGLAGYESETLQYGIVGRKTVTSSAAYSLC